MNAGFFLFHFVILAGKESVSVLYLAVIKKGGKVNKYCHKLFFAKCIYWNRSKVRERQPNSQIKTNEPI